jgi:putative Mg2+ transporter-C (MgtC) family protein
MLPEAAILLKTILAAVLGGVVGLERGVMEKPAGVRTYSIVCIASALFTAVGFATVGSAAQGHVLAGIVTGVGFIGAGVIFRSEEKVRGITTAADLWAVAIIGIAVGLGYYILAITTTVIIEAVLVMGRLLEGKLKLKGG